MMFKAKQRVYCMVYGWGTVDAIGDVVTVTHDDQGRAAYTPNGVIMGHDAEKYPYFFNRRVLFFDEPDWSQMSKRPISMVVKPGDKLFLHPKHSPSQSFALIEVESETEEGLVYVVLQRVAKFEMSLSFTHLVHNPEQPGQGRLKRSVLKEYVFLRVEDFTSVVFEEE